MRVVIAPQAFKGSLSAREACRAMKEGLHRALPEAEGVLVPMADGGDGTLEALVEISGGRYITTLVTGPQGDAVEATWGLIESDATAVIEMARASGLVLLAGRPLDPRTATSRGTGELILAALDRGARHIILGVGGSATNDGGAGLARALGARFLDREGCELPPGGAALARLERIDVSGLDARLAECSILVACDVTNPLTGPRGASAVYGPQKGATPAMVRELDAALARYAQVIKEQLGKDLADIPGAGAAGGLPVALLVFCRAELRPGVDVVAEAVGLEEKLKGADLVITGEGRLDGSALYNKAPIGVARRAKRLGIPAIAVVGSLGDGYEAALAEGIVAVETLVSGDVSLEEAQRDAFRLLSEATERAVRKRSLP
ncbi:MAG: glycerate kinase [Chloroflexi bacterium]|nr:glycerate kinase [Chloroflexota bacterium]